MWVYAKPARLNSFVSDGNGVPPWMRPSKDADLFLFLRVYNTVEPTPSIPRHTTAAAVPGCDSGLIKKTDQEMSHTILAYLGKCLIEISITCGNLDSSINLACM